MNLNSVLIEGVLVNDPVPGRLVKGKPVCILTIATQTRYCGGASNRSTEESLFEIEVPSIVHAYRRVLNPAAGCFRLGERGRGVRIVGALKQVRWTENGVEREKVIIAADHVEWRPKGFE